MAEKQNNLLSIGLIPIAATVVGFVAAAAISILVVQSAVNSGHRAQLGQTVAQELAQQINIHESKIRLLLAKLAESSLATEAINGTNAEVFAAESQLALLIPDADRVRLIKRGEAKADQGFPPLNYTAVDLIRNLEDGSNPAAEAISSQPQLEGEKWIIFATPIKAGDGTIRGTLFVHIRAAALTREVTAETTGEVKIMQMVGKTPKPFAVAGGGGAGTIYTHALNNPNWSIEFSPSSQLDGSTPASLVMYLIPALVMLIAGLAGIVVGSNRTIATLEADLASLGSQITKVATGSFDASIEYSLPGFKDPNAKLRILQDVKPAAKPSPATEPKTASEKSPEAMVDIQMVEEGDAEIEEFEVDDFESVVEEASQPAPAKVDISEHIFRANDIRGIVGETLSEDIARQIGLAIGSEAEARGQQSLLVGFDGREYSPALSEALMDGLIASGRDVTNIGSVPTPVLYYGTENSDTRSGVMVTGSHNAPGYNGFKIVLDGRSLMEDDIKALYTRIANDDFTSGDGNLGITDLTQDYMDAIVDDVVIAQPLKIVVDCGNGIAGAIAPELLDSLGCETVPLYCEVDGSFPNHHPDPTKPENLEDLVLTVQSQGADLGIGLDGDGDRLVAVTAEGEIVWPDRLLMLFAKDIVSRNPGSDVVYDVKCTRHLNSVISGFGGRPIISRSGHSFIKDKLKETGALLGGEFSGHICFSERWFGFDDGLYSAARLLEIVGSQEDSLTDLLQEFPVSVSTPEIHIEVEDSEKFILVEALTAAADFEDATITTIDGLRVDFTDGWGLVRASNTEPAITLRFEADSDEAIEDIKGAFRELLQEVREDLNFS